MSGIDDMGAEELRQLVRQLVRAATPSRWWAKVASTSPLEITRAGQPAPVPVARCLVAGLQVGDLVLAEIDGTELRVIGKHHTY
ncbi:hypothetical protein [Serinicoccus sediminis]|uniref:hypothetical protein n=1 Tax=Serinicoccus sediminis TaxID=2306021 RepID=UPI0010213B23|nr:hypothetical protein [Serinicoccus sediminis]